MNGNKPTNKVTGGALAGAIVTLGVFIAQQFGVAVTPEVAAGAVTILSAMTSWFVKDA